MSEKAKCPAKVHPSGMFWRVSHQCGRTASHEHEGVMYCKTHHPPTVKAKMDERQKAYRDKSEFEMERINLLNQAIAVKAEYGLTPRELVEERGVMTAALRHCENMLMAHSINRVDHEAIEDEALSIIRAALANTERKT